MEMGSECSMLFLTGHTVVFGRETNVWLSVKECHLSAPALGDKSVLGCQEARSTGMVSLSQLGR